MQGVVISTLALDGEVYTHYKLIGGTELTPVSRQSAIATKSIETVKYCQEYFAFSLPSVLWAKRVAKFEVSFGCLLSVL